MMQIKYVLSFRKILSDIELHISSNQILNYMYFIWCSLRTMYRYRLKKNFSFKKLTMYEWKIF